MAKRRKQPKGASVGVLEALAEKVVRDVVPAIERKLSRFLEDGEPPPDLRQLPPRMIRDVRRRRARLEEARQAEGCAETALTRSRSARDEASARVHGLLAELRKVTLAVSRRRPAVGPVWVVPAVPPQPHALLRFAERMLKRLRGPEPLLPERSPVRLDSEKTAFDLDQAAGALDRALNAVALRSAEAVRMQEERKDAEAGFEAACAAGRRLLEALDAYGEVPDLV